MVGARVRAATRAAGAAARRAARVRSVHGAALSVVGADADRTMLSNRGMDSIVHRNAAASTPRASNTRTSNNAFHLMAALAFARPAAGECARCLSEVRQVTCPECEREITSPPEYKARIHREMEFPHCRIPLQWPQWVGVADLGPFACNCDERNPSLAARDQTGTLLLDGPRHPSLRTPGIASG